MSRRPAMILRSSSLLNELMKGRYNTVTLAAQVGVTKQTISHLTSGRRNSCSVPTAERLSEALGCEVDTLFSIPSSENSNSEEGEVFHTIPEAGVLLKVSRAHAYRLVADGELKTIDVGRPGAKKPKSRVPQSSIDAWTAKREAAQSAR